MTTPEILTAHVEEWRRLSTEERRKRWEGSKIFPPSTARSLMLITPDQTIYYGTTGSVYPISIRIPIFPTSRSGHIDRLRVDTSSFRDFWSDLYGQTRTTPAALMAELNRRVHGLDPSQVPHFLKETLEELKRLVENADIRPEELHHGKESFIVLHPAGRLGDHLNTIPDDSRALVDFGNEMESQTRRTIGGDHGLLALPLGEVKLIEAITGYLGTNFTN